MNVGTETWETITSAENVIKINRWQHVTVSVDHDLSVNLYVDALKLVKVC